MLAHSNKLVGQLSPMDKRTVSAARHNLPL
jgi:hypothetical protein